MQMQRLGPPCPVMRLANGVYRFEMKLSRTPDRAWSRLFMQRLRRRAVHLMGSLVVFDARGAEFPEWLAQLDAAVHAANRVCRDRALLHAAEEKVA